jgi:hypothetical protein
VGRAAVLAAPTTHPALAVLELKAALLERLEALLAMPAASGESSVVAEVRRREALSPAAQRLLHQLLAAMGTVERALVSSRKAAIAARRVQQMHQNARALIEEAQQRLESRS